MTRRARLLPKEFYQRDAIVVARGLLGHSIVREDVVLRISEVEAYCWPDDSACHGRFGRTARNAVMWGPGGHAYVYLCYGLHQMLNVVANPPDEAAAVLIRACEPIAGLDTIRRRRGGLEGPVLLTGPGKIGAALALDSSWSGHPLYKPGPLEIREGDPPSTVLIGPRVGVDYAKPAHRDAPWRFALADTPWVSVPRGLRPEGKASKRRKRS
jgi:DNA-3-methyladenine glycosylase